MDAGQRAECERFELPHLPGLQRICSKHNAPARLRASANPCSRVVVANTCAVANGKSVCSWRNSPNEVRASKSRRGAAHDLSDRLAT
jgi:hypothetical protein